MVDVFLAKSVKRSTISGYSFRWETCSFASCRGKLVTQIRFWWTRIPIIQSALPIRMPMLSRASQRAVRGGAGGA
jgi:hypothetical protein